MFRTFSTTQTYRNQIRPEIKINAIIKYSNFLFTIIFILIRMYSVYLSKANNKLAMAEKNAEKKKK